ncbi:MAG: rRNA maturation RNase YbeY [Clostridia bacterium]|nr:rRNA maturation RNase YbeY [Clostridia bacterium]
MRIEWQVDVDVQLPDWMAEQALLEAVARAAVDAANLPGRYQACVVLTDDQGIRQLNQQTRGIDDATDVLSFPQIHFPWDIKQLRALLDPDTGCRHLGDVVISVERARAQADQYGHDLRRELGYLLVHGMCHLLGYDHVRDEDKARMRAAEEAAMARVGLPRESLHRCGGPPPFNKGGRG